MIPFGKYKRKTFNQISQIDPYYIIWITENVKSIKLPKNLWIRFKGVSQKKTTNCKTL